ncbi:MAG: hypothetical protein KAR39_12490 [Thermoplasmata archaeon]|nr:hypothetical protein [Thermoplasmata archaeon]
MHTLNPEDVEEVIELREVMRQLLDTEPGHHPELPTTIHKIIRAMLTTLVYTLNLTEEIRHEVTQHRLDQELSDSALHKIFKELGLFTPDTFQKAIVQVTEELGATNVGKA